MPPSLLFLLFLAVLQGLTEFLPVSSSGHLVLARQLCGSESGFPEDASLEVWLHLGTLSAVLVYYRRRVMALAQGVFGFGADAPEQRRLFLLLLLASVPAGLVGTVFEDSMSKLYASSESVGVALCVTGCVLWASRFLRPQTKTLTQITVGAALLIGIVQAVAITPGISRSGFTIVAALALGFEVRAAAAFSFLLSVPAIAGASLLKVPQIFEEGQSAMPTAHLGLSFALSAVVGYFALGLLVWMAKNQRLSWFAPYCWIAGLFVLL